MIYLTLIRALIAGGVCWGAIQIESKILAVYWLLVMLYWLVNAFAT